MRWARVPSARATCSRPRTDQFACRKTPNQHRLDSQIYLSASVRVCRPLSSGADESRQECRPWNSRGLFGGSSLARLALTERDACLRQTQRAVRTSAHLVSIMVVLSVVFPAAREAYLERATLRKRALAAARTRIQTAVTQSWFDCVGKCHPHLKLVLNENWRIRRTLSIAGLARPAEAGPTNWFARGVGARFRWRDGRRLRRRTREPARCRAGA